MNDNDVDDLARVLAEHSGPRWSHRYGWRCNCGDELSMATLDEMGDAITTHARHVAAAVLASGVVVSARDHERTKEGARTLGHIVETQCRDALDATGLHHLIDEDGDGDWGLVWEHLAEMGERHRALARDVKALAEKWRRQSVPLFNTGLGSVRANELVACAEANEALLREPATDAAPTRNTQGDGWLYAELERAAAESRDTPHELRPVVMPETGHQSAPDATEPADPYPSDPQRTAGPQEDA